MPALPAGSGHEQPRVLFVSRERFRLPLDGAQKRKWDAVAAVVDHRVLAAAPEGWPTRRRALPARRARAAAHPRRRALLPAAAVSHRARAARVPARRRARAGRPRGRSRFSPPARYARVPTKVILDVQGDWHEATRLYGSPFRRLLNPVNDAFAPYAVRGADAVRTVSTQTTGLVESLGVDAGRDLPVVCRRRRLSSNDRPAALPDAAARGLRRRARALQGVRHPGRGVAARRAAACPTRCCTSSAKERSRDRAEELVADLPEQTEWSRRLAAEEVAAAMDASWLVCLPSRSEGLPRVALEAACRGRAIVGGNRAGIPDVVQRRRERPARRPRRSRRARRRARPDPLRPRRLPSGYGAAARRTGEEWGVTPAEYAAKVRALVDRLLAG